MVDMTEASPKVLIKAFKHKERWILFMQVKQTILDSCYASTLGSFD